MSDTTFSFYIWKWTRWVSTHNSTWELLPQISLNSFWGINNLWFTGPCHHTIIISQFRADSPRWVAVRLVPKERDLPQIRAAVSTEPQALRTIFARFATGPWKGVLWLLWEPGEMLLWTSESSMVSSTYNSQLLAEKSSICQSTDFAHWSPWLSSWHCLVDPGTWGVGKKTFEDFDNEKRWKEKALVF